MSNSPIMSPVAKWLSESALAEMYTADYWNDIAAEQHKEWWIADGNYSACLRYLEEKGLLRQYSATEKLVTELSSSFGREIVVADLGAGIGWASACLSRLPCVREIISVELSLHRLDQLFPHAVQMMGGIGTKIGRCLGSFYDLAWPNESIDIIVMFQSFHHADNPLRLVVECDRVLRSGGRIVIAGEHYISRLHIIRAVFATLRRKGRLNTRFFELFRPDDRLGDHYYRVSDYYSFFGALGYRVRHHFVGARSPIYVIDKP